MTIFSVSDARKHLCKLIDEVKEAHRPVYSKGKRNSAVLISEEDWRAIVETLYLDLVPGMRESIRKGLTTPIDECSDTGGW